jgi:hypothetical protein
MYNKNVSQHTILYCHDLGVCDYKRGMDWWNGFTDHLYTSLGTRITALSLISTLYKSPQHSLPFPSNSFNSGDSSASRAQVLSSQPPVQNSTLNRQLPGWRPFHTNLLVFSLQADFQLTLCQLTSNWVTPTVFHITTLHGPSRKHRFQQ